MLELTALHKSYGSRPAVVDLSLAARRGEILGLLGPNGAGKSTTVNMIAGLLRPDSGSIDIDIDGERGSPSDPDVRRRLGVAPQTVALYEDLTGVENLRFFGALYGLHGAALERRAGASLESVGLADRGGDRVSGYSGGMKRRLNLAAALLHEPALLILDEPTGGVDPQSRNAILETTESLRDNGTTVIYTTHYMEEAARLCDRVAIIDRGSVLATGTVDELIATHGGDNTLVAEIDGEQVRTETADALAELNRLAASGDLGRFHVERPSLEQVFLHLTGRSLRD
jgi:ABC-2 type transport system ATP-binding protein